MSTTTRKAIVLGIVTSAAVAMLVVSLSAFPQEKAKTAMTMSKEVVWPAAEMKFNAAIPGVEQAVLWGDPTKGAYGAVTRFKAGQKNPLHTHSHDIKMVVISGTFIHGTESGEKKLGPGSYLLVPGGMKHTSGANTDADCLFFEESPGKFDMQVVAKQ